MNRKIILIRHGQSTYNLENRFTGWKDVELTEKGRNEAINAVGLEIRTMKKKAYEYSKKELMNMIEAEENKIIKKGGMKAVRIAALSAIGLPFLGFL